MVRDYASFWELTRIVESLTSWVWRRQGAVYLHRHRPATSLTPVFQDTLATDAF